MARLRVYNIRDNETVHQQCLLLKGQCPLDTSVGQYVTVKTIDGMKTAESVHNWPTDRGEWKALVLLVPGHNNISISLQGGSDSISFQVIYQPLLQVPPLHLAILVAKDSPLIIDCPPAKYGAISAAHNSLDAVIAKFRMTAYMWQALTAEDMQDKGLGRRSFRLEDEWGPDTAWFQTVKTSAEGTAVMKTQPKVHIIRTDKTVAELRDPMLAQQNSRGRQRDELHAIFSRALKAHGAPFDSACRPVVAGLILDSHYSLDQDLILGHAALGAHNRNGLSLGVFGSHLSYSWPRTVEEVVSCLLDTTPPGDTVGDDNGECTSMARACFIGQGAFMHEVGHAFGADHTEGIMARGYSKGWGTEFINHEMLHAIHKDGIQQEHDRAKWAMQDVLRFNTMAHFRKPGDEPLSTAFIHANISVTAETDEEFDQDWLQISSLAGLVKLQATDGEHSHSVQHSPSTQPPVLNLDIRNLSVFDRTKPLEISVLALNGKQRTIQNAWKLFRQKTYIRMPGTDVRLKKQSVRSSGYEGADNDESYKSWTCLLHKPSHDGASLVPASAIDLRVGCTFDGAVVYYNDKTYSHTQKDGRPANRFGGHASEKHNLQEGFAIVKVEVTKSDRWGQGSLNGVRMTLASGETWGHLNERAGDDEAIHVFEPGPDEKIVALHGTSMHYIEEFGIITAPKAFVLPKEAYGLPELQNNLIQNDGMEEHAYDSGGDDNDDEEWEYDEPYL